MYHPAAFDPARPHGAYWLDDAGPAPADDGALDHDVDCDVAIVGGGFTGLWAARRLAGTHGRRVRLFEAGPIGWGASGRNGGFACLGGSGLTYRQIVDRVGLDEARRYCALQRDALMRVRRMIEPGVAPDEALGPGEFVIAHSPGRRAELVEEQRMLAALYGIDATLYDREALHRAGLAGPHFHSGLHTPIGFPVQPAKLLYTLLIAARGAGAHVHSRTPVTSLERDGADWIVVTPQGRCRAGRVIIATNGYGRDGPAGAAMDGRILPVQSNILVTRPLSEAERAAQGWTTSHLAYDSRILLHYFRLLPDGRFLFGGRGGLSADPDSLARSRAWLTGSFRRLFPAWRDVEITHFWRGFVGFAADRAPHAGPLDETRTLWFGGGYHGNGIGLSAGIGHLLADLAAGAADPEADVPALLRGPPPRFRLPALRMAALRAGYLWYRVRDAMP